jgi:hypothetical protein
MASRFIAARRISPEMGGGGIGVGRGRLMPSRLESDLLFLDLHMAVWHESPEYDEFAPKFNIQILVQYAI